MHKEIAMILPKLTPIEQVSAFLPFYRDEVLSLQSSIKNNIREIRIRVGQKITLETGTKRIKLSSVCRSDEPNELINIFCERSLHSFSKQLSEGVITLPGGHRAGFCGTAITEGKVVTGVRDITSINIRIAREFIGISDTLINCFYGEFNRKTPEITSIKNVVILGKPASGKTTFLRDFIRHLSQNSKISVIDERSEIAGKMRSGITFDLGENTDVLDGFPKLLGTITAIRALSPDYIAFDEVSTDIEDAIFDAANAGVNLLLTAHAGSIDEFKNSYIYQKIMSRNIDFSAVLLDKCRLSEFRCSIT